MEFDAVLLAPRRAQAVAQGHWRDRTINDELDACVREQPDKTALTAVRVESGETRRFSCSELAALADRVAVGLSRLGVGRNDIVAMQLPNWWQFPIVYLARSRLGAVFNPLMHLFRERELSFMLKHGKAKVLIVPKPDQSPDLASMVEFLKSQKVAVQYIPERLVVREAMPVTTCGKIQKFKLRDMLRDGTL